MWGSSARRVPDFVATSISQGRSGGRAAGIESLSCSDETSSSGVVSPLTSTLTSPSFWEAGVPLPIAGAGW